MVNSSLPPPVCGFRCATCGVWHEGVPLDFSFEFPELGVPPDEWDRRVWTDGNFCVVDGREYFVRGCLEIPVRDGPGPLVYGVWTSLRERSYRRARELSAAANVPADEPPWFGWFASTLAHYPQTLLLKSLVYPRPAPLRPLIELEPTDHPLSVEQREGISGARLVEIVQRLLHTNG